MTRRVIFLLAGLLATWPVATAPAQQSVRTGLTRYIDSKLNISVESFGGDVPMQRAADPDEIAPSYIFFAAGRLSAYYTGEVLAPVGGETLPG